MESGVVFVPMEIGGIVKLGLGWHVDNWATVKRVGRNVLIIIIIIHFTIRCISETQHM